MGIFTLTAPSRAAIGPRTQLQDPGDLLFGSTMGAGTSLLTWEPVGEAAGYVAISIDAILAYERTILNLRRELLHYKRLLVQLSGIGAESEEYGQAERILPMSVESIRVLDSILAARIQPNATFLEFEEGEL